MVIRTPASVSPGLIFCMEAICRSSSAMPSMLKASSLMGTITSSAAAPEQPVQQSMFRPIHAGGPTPFDKEERK